MMGGREGGRVMPARSLPVVQLYSVPPESQLWLGPDQPGPLAPCETEPDHEAAAVAQLVRVAVVVEEQRDGAVPVVFISC